ncbi:MAG: hypothetical protein Q8N37_00290 [bacterium]|nr:hypothetical protein [bacterium]
MSIKSKQLAVQLGIIVFTGLTFNTAVTASKAETFQLTVIAVYAVILMAAYKISVIWQFCQKNFKMAKIPSSKKGTPH